MGGEGFLKETPRCRGSASSRVDETGRLGAHPECVSCLDGEGFRVCERGKFVSSARDPLMDLRYEPRLTIESERLERGLERERAVRGSIDHGTQHRCGDPAIDRLTDPFIDFCSCEVYLRPLPASSIPSIHPSSSSLIPFSSCSIRSRKSQSGSGEW